MIDLEELVLKCRNETAKENIKEAIKCYRSGAYRSSIISTWLAVFYDILEKYKELGSINGHEFDEEGEANSENEVSLNKLARKEYQKYRQLFLQFEKNQTKENLGAIMKYESDILEKIHKEFQFISYTEFIDLQRLKEDRNRCAHPSFDLNLDTYKPSAEIARAHIRAAVECLLQYPATAGNHVIKIIMDELNSDYTPKTRNSFYDYMKGTPITRLKKNTIRGVLSSMFDFSLKEGFAHKNRYIYMYKLMRELYPVDFESYLAVDVSSRFRINSMEDEEIILYRMLYWVIWTDLFQYLNSTLKIKILGYIEGLKINKAYHLSCLQYLLGNTDTEVLSSAKKRVENLSEIDFNVEESSVIFEGDILDRFISLNVNTASFDIAKNCAEIFENLSFDWDKARIKYFIYHGAKNYVVRKEGTGFGRGSFYQAQLYFRTHHDITEEEMNDWIQKADAGDSSFLEY